MIMHRLFVCAALLALLALAAACKSDEPPPSGTTLTQTLGVDSEGNLVVAEGEPYTVRTELAQAQSDRRDRRLSLVVFHQLSDFGIVDEESPLRSEWLEACNSAVNDKSFRSQESLSLHVAEALIAQANVVDRSPVTRAPVDFAIHTGSAADNAQFNELRWFIDLMDGAPVDPESGAVGYEGVQTESPAKAYADLLTLAQEAFIPEGINYPWYAVAGNHDALSQGNFPLTERAAEVATGAQKIFALGPAALAEVCDSGSIFGPGPSAELLNDPGTIIRGVGADKNRRLISHSDWIREHLPPPNTGPGPLGHGFSIQGANEGRAYYTFEENGVVFIVLDSANPSGFPSGSLDQAQYDWLEERLTAHSSSYADGGGQFVTTENADRLMVIVSHHPSAVMTNPYPGTDGEPRTLPWGGGGSRRPLSERGPLALRPHRAQQHFGQARRCRWRLLGSDDGRRPRLPDAGSPDGDRRQPRRHALHLHDDVRPGDDGEPRRRRGRDAGGRAQPAAPRRRRSSARLP